MHASLELARKIERAIARQSAFVAVAAGEREHARGACWAPIADGLATFLGHDAPLGRAHALGLEGPVGEGAIDELEAFYRARGAATGRPCEAKIELCPLADAALVAALGARGFSPRFFINTHAMARGDAGELAAVEGVRVERAGQEHLDDWVRTVARGFAEGDEPQPGIVALMTSSARSRGLAGYLAFADGKPAGGGSLTIVDVPDADWRALDAPGSPGTRVAILAGASTLPWARRRGVQTALLRARIRHALEAGASLLVMQSRPGTASERNMHRAGARLVYSKVSLSRVLTDA